MGRVRATAHPRTATLGALVYLPIIGNIWRSPSRFTGLLWYTCGHRCDADRERVPPVLGLGSLEARLLSATSAGVRHGDLITSLGMMIAAAMGFWASEALTSQGCVTKVSFNHWRW